MDSLQKLEATNSLHSTAMPLPFRNRKGKNANESSSTNGTSSVATAAGSHVDASAIEKKLPSQECRKAVLESVMAAAASVYIHHGVKASMEMHDDPEIVFVELMLGNA